MMWYLEFTEGHLKGIVLKLDDAIFLKNNADERDKTVLVVPECLNKNSKLEFKIENGNPVLTDEKDKQTILKSNKIYKNNGIEFFVYEEGFRKPKVYSYNLTKYRLFFIFTLIVNVVVTFILGYFLIQSYKEQLSNNINMLDGVYIKDGVVYSTDESMVDSLSEHWDGKITYVNTTNEDVLSQLRFKVISESTKERIPVVVNEKDGYDEIVVKTYERENTLLFLLNNAGILVKKVDDSWFVSDMVESKKLIINKGYQDFLERLKSLEIKSKYLLTKDEFPYDVFYSSSLGGYVYNSHSRYWEGSYLPNIGKIVKITNKKIEFINDEGENIIYQF